VSDEVEELRRKVLEATIDVLRAVRRRVELVEELGRVKKRRGMPIRSPEVERELIFRVRKEGESMGLDPDFCEKLTRMLIEYSVSVQARRVYG